MAYKWNEICIEDTYQKYTCCRCEKEFIVGEENAIGCKLNCPYCHHDSVDQTAEIADDFYEETGGLSCMGIYVNLDKSMYEEIESILSKGVTIYEIAEKYSGENCVKDYGMSNDLCHEDADCNDCWIKCLEKSISE